MDVKDVVSKAKEYVKVLFEGESIENVGLEEVSFDDETKSWRVTIGFNRPWDQIKNVADLMSALGEREVPDWKRRSFKVIRIPDDTGKPVSLTHREPVVDGALRG